MIVELTKEEIERIKWCVGMNYYDCYYYTNKAIIDKLDNLKIEGKQFNDQGAGI